MNNLIVFLRHAETQVDLNLKTSEWILSDLGKKQSKELCQIEIFSNFNSIFSSPEKKALQTIEPLLEVNKIEVQIIDELKELNRDAGPSQKTKQEYNKIVKMALENREYNYNNWEKASIALHRFEKTIKKIQSTNEKQKILIVSHGLILSLFFAKKMNALNMIYERWKRTEFCSYGIMMNNKIIKDITSLQ